jgi:hypothetical protein
MGKQVGPDRIKALSAPARQALDTGRVEGRFRPRLLMALLRELGVFDRATAELLNEAHKRQASGVTQAIILVIVAVISAAMLSQISTVFLWASLGALVIAGVGAARALKGRSEARRLEQVDLLDDFHALLLPFLRDIQEDLAPRGRIRVALQLDGIQDHKLTDSRERSYARFDMVQEWTYHDPWCELEAALVDGSHIQLALSSEWTRQERRWRNPRGKTKRRTKWKKLVTLQAAVRPPASGLDWRAADGISQETSLKVKERDGQEIRRLVRKAKFKSLEAPPAQTMAARDVVGAFLKLFGMLAPKEEGA